MIVMDIWSDLENELESYRVSVSIIKQYLYVYEEECGYLIERISSCSCFEEAVEYIDALYEVQCKLATVKYKFEFPLNSKLQEFVYCLDRDDIYSRKYWYEEFRKGLKWPVE